MGKPKAQDLSLCIYCLFLALVTKVLPVTLGAHQSTRKLDIFEEEKDVEFRSNSMGVSKVIDLNTRTIAYKDHILKTCYIEKITNQSIWDKDRVLIVHPKLLTNEQVATFAGRIIANFCFGWPSKILRPPEEYRRKRSHQQYYFVGRKTRGQSQSQYLNYGNTEPGKAEAESTRQGSKATVSGTNGMGQAQSQSDPFSCADCFGASGRDQIGGQDSTGSLYHPGRFQQSGSSSSQFPGSRGQVGGSTGQGTPGQTYIPGTTGSGTSGIGGPGQPTQHIIGGIPGTNQFTGTHGTGGGSQFPPGGQQLYTPDGKIIHVTQQPGSPTQHGQVLGPAGGPSSGSQTIYDHDGIRKPSGRPGWSASDSETLFNQPGQTIYQPEQPGQSIYQTGGTTQQPGQQPGHITYPTGTTGQTSIPSGSPGHIYQPGASGQPIYQPGLPGQTGPSGQSTYYTGSPGQTIYQQGSPGQITYPPGSSGQSTQQLRPSGQSIYQPGSPGQTIYQQGSPGQGTYQPGSSSQTTQQNGSPGQTIYQPGSPGQSIYQQGSPGQVTYQPGSPTQTTQQTGTSGQTTQQSGLPGQTIYQPGSVGQGTYQPGSPSQTTQQTGSPGQTIYQPGLPGQTTYQPGSPGQLTYQPGVSYPSSPTGYRPGQHPGQISRLPGQSGETTYQPGQTTYFIPGGMRPRPGEDGSFITGPGTGSSETRQFDSQGGTFSGHLAGEYETPTSQSGKFSGSFQGRYNTHGESPQLIYQGSLPGGSQGVVRTDTISPGTVLSGGQILPDGKVPGGIQQGITSFPSDTRGGSHTQQVYYPGSGPSTSQQPGRFGIFTPGIPGTGIQEQTGSQQGGGSIGMTGTGGIGQTITSGQQGGSVGMTGTGGLGQTITNGQHGGGMTGIGSQQGGGVPGGHTQQIQYPGALTRLDGGVNTIPGSSYPGHQQGGRFDTQQLGAGQQPSLPGAGVIQQPSGTTTGTSLSPSQQAYNQQYPGYQVPGQQTTSVGPGGTLHGQYPISQTTQQMVPGGQIDSQTIYGPGGVTGTGQGMNIYGQQPGAQTFEQTPGQMGTGLTYDGQTGTGLLRPGESQPTQTVTSGGPPGSGSLSAVNQVGTDDANSQAESSIQRVNNETQASASSSGRFAGGNAQSQVSGSYSGQGSFSASAGTNDGLRGAQTQVSGNSEGAISSSQGQGGKGKSQTQVQMAADTGDTTSSAQTGGLNHGTNTQVQSGIKGGMADAQANGPGSTSSQAQIGFTPYDSNANDDNAQNPHNGGGTASASSGTHAGKSQVQINGKYAFGIRYTGQAQASSANSGFTASEINLPTMKPIDFSQNKYDKPTRQQEKVNTRQVEESKILQIVTRSTTPFPDDDLRDSDYDEDDYIDPESEERRSLNLVQQQQTRSLMHDALDPLEDIAEPPKVELTGRPKHGDVIQAGEYIPGTNGYKIPAGFRGRITNDPHSAVDNTRRIVYGAGVKTNRHSNTGYGTGYTYQQPYAPIEYGFKSGSAPQPKFVSVTKSETGSRNVLTGKKTPSVYYTQSSTCGYFTNTCVYSNGKKICLPKPKANADGTPIVCRN